MIKSHAKHNKVTRKARSLVRCFETYKTEVLSFKNNFNEKWSE